VQFSHLMCNDFPDSALVCSNENISFDITPLKFCFVLFGPTAQHHSILTIYLHIKASRSYCSSTKHKMPSL